MVINEKLIPEINVREYRNEVVREILQKNLAAYWKTVQIPSQTSKPAFF